MSERFVPSIGFEQPTVSKKLWSLSQGESPEGLHLNSDLQSGNRTPESTQQTRCDYQVRHYAILSYVVW